MFQEYCCKFSRNVFDSSEAWREYRFYVDAIKLLCLASEYLYTVFWTQLRGTKNTKTVRIELMLVSVEWSSEGYTHLPNHWSPDTYSHITPSVIWLLITRLSCIHPDKTIRLYPPAWYILSDEVCITPTILNSNVIGHAAKSGPIFPGLNSH